MSEGQKNRERNVLGAASASWGDRNARCADGKSSLQQGGDLCLPGDFYVDELQQSMSGGLAEPWPVAGRETRLWDKPAVPPLLHLCLVPPVLLLDGQDALALLDELHAAVGDEPDGQGAHGET